MHHTTTALTLLLLLTACNRPDKGQAPEPGAPGAQEEMADLPLADAPMAADGTVSGKRGAIDPVTGEPSAPTTPEDGTPTEAGETTEAPADGTDAAPTAPTRPGTGAAPGQAEERGPPKGLEIVSGTSWRVPRVLAERWEEHYNRIGRFRQVDDGWRLRVRDRSAGWWLGMRTGDVILEVNGMKLNTKPQLIAAYLKLRNKDKFEVLIRRQGATRTHHYSIID